MRGAPQIRVDEELLADISATLDLRDPNTMAVRTLAGRMGAWQAAGHTDTSEMVLDVATGVGKTYVMAAAMDYLAAFGVTDFVVFVPNRAILTKTLNNFTPGHPKAVVDAMQCDPTVVTVDDLESPATRALMDDPTRVKVYVVTVQSFTGLIAKDVKRRAHTFQEALGANFYAQLQEMQGLVVFADEHHTYDGPAFGRAVRDLAPMALIGLTGTPSSNTPPESIVYRYPLANAIADRLVKTPVLVGRSDELADDRTKLLDSVALLEAKQTAADEYADRTGEPTRNLLMLVVAKDIADAEIVEGILTDPSFHDGAYAEKVLTVHSDQPEEALEALEAVEEPDSPHRIIVSVAMLKEGWDVATVAVICSLRASVSELLTEQTLGRGLRLPWGRYVDDPLLNELDVIAHEQYEKVLRKARVLQEELIDWRTWQAEQTAVATALATEAASQHAAEEVRAQIDAITTATPTTPTATDDEEDAEPLVMRVEEVGGRKDALSDAASRPLRPSMTLGTVQIPVLTSARQTLISDYRLSDVLGSGREAIQRLGERFAHDPVDTLRREALVAVVETDDNGIPRTRITTAPAETAIRAATDLPPLADTRLRLIDHVLASDYATGRTHDGPAAANIVDALIDGAGDKADTLGAYLPQVAGALLRTVGQTVTELAATTRFAETVELHGIQQWTRKPAEITSDDLTGDYVRGTGYTGWAKTPYEQVVFGSSTERACALILDAPDNTVQFWINLNINDLKVVWHGRGKLRDYNPDFIVVERPARGPRGVRRNCWIVEVKADKYMHDPEVEAKHLAARQWVERVNTEPTVEDNWQVLRVSETDIANARGDWNRLKHLGVV